MNALAPTPLGTTRSTRTAGRGVTSRLISSTGLAGVLLTAALVGAGPADAGIPVEPDRSTARATGSLVLVNGVHTMAGVTAKLERQR